MEHGAILRVIYKKCLKINGEHELGLDRYSIVLPKFSVVGQRSKKVAANKQVTLAADATVESIDRIITVRPNPEFYKLGLCVGDLIIDSSDGVVRPSFVFKPTEDCDLGSVLYFCKLYTHRKGA